MKKSIFTVLPALLTFAIALSAASCESFTDVPLPKSQITTPAVFQDRTTANAAFIDILARLRENSLVCGDPHGLSSAMGLYSDELTLYSSSSPVTDFYNHTVVASNATVMGLWTNSYSQIFAANSLLEGSQASQTLTQADKDYFTGQALFLRAYIHFYLTNVFGDIPYITTTDYLVNASIARIQTQHAFELIIQDLTQAITLLPEEVSGQQTVIPVRATAQALLARVQLYAGNYADAADLATSVINSGTYAMEQNLSEAFLKDSPSVLWSLHPGMSGENTKDATTFIFTEGPPPFASLSAQLLAAFEPGDLRREQWVGTVGEWSYPFKYKQSQNTGESVEFTVLFRLAELYLIRAECRTMLGDFEGARQDLNQLRLRAGLPAATAATQEDLMTAVLHERQTELFCELGHRMFDLKRSGTAAEILAPLKPAWQASHLVLPIPESELLLNPSLQPQNPGY